MIGSLHTQGSQIRPRLLTHQGAAELLRRLVLAGFGPKWPVLGSEVLVRRGPFFAKWPDPASTRRLATRLRGGAQDSFVIFDLGDDTYHAGEGAWTDNPDEALRYDSEEEAQRGIEEVDCDAILRDRLVIRSADLA